MHSRTVSLLVVALVAGCSAAEGPRPSPDRAALEALLDSHRRAHLELDADRLVEQIADELMSVDSGVVTVQTREEVRETFASYFEGATYFAWDDLEPPLIEISDDGTLAWVIRRVAVDREEPDGSGGKKRRRFVSAYTSTFEHSDGKWWMTSVTSTFVPSEKAEGR